MAKPVRVTVRGPEDDRITAPTGDDLIGQIRDFLDVLRGVEETVGEGGNQLVWRVTDAKMNSPISLEFTPYGTGPTADVLARAELVEKRTADGFRAMRHGETRPLYFNDSVLAKAKRIHQRVLNGLSDTVIAFDPDVEREPVVIDRPAAREVELASEKQKGLASIPYRELGSVEGFVTKPELDGYERAILRFRSRLDNEEIKAYARGHAFHQIERLRLSDVWQGVRVRVYGLIHYKGLGQIDCINATSIEVLDSEPLPGMDDIVDPNFTGGLTTEEFLRQLRADD
jgi:hypothetical protein